MKFLSIFALKKGALAFIASTFLLSSASFTNAATTPTPTCKPIFGGGSYNCTSNGLTVDKTVQDAQSGVFVQNLGINDSHFTPESTITFRIIVKNTSSESINSITLKDTFPQYITYTSGDGKYDSSSKSLTISLSSLKKGESKQYDIKAKVAKVQELPQDQSVICLTNQALAKSSDQTISDNTQFCVQRQAGVTVIPTNTTKGNVVNPTPTIPSVSKGGQVVYPITVNQSVTKTPSTGPEALALFALAPAGLLGSFLRRKAAK